MRTDTQKKENIARILFDIAKKEREIFIEQNGREPTESEAQRMVEMIIRTVLRVAFVLTGENFSGYGEIK